VKLAFIGGGNMAQAMLGGLNDGGIEASAVHVLEPDRAKGKELAKDFCLSAHTGAGDWLHEVDVVVLAVKPQQMREAVRPVAEHCAAALVISIAAGIRGNTLQRWLGHDRIVRAMPNTPALVRAGITGAVALAGVSAAQRAAADRILRTTGSVMWLADEALLDPVTAISGSGPAYVFYFIEALQQAAQGMGFSDEQATTLALQTFLGATRLADQSEVSVATLRERVTSKGGTTAAGLAQLDAAGVRAGIIAAAQAALARAKELGDEFDRD